MLQIPSEINGYNFVLKYSCKSIASGIYQAFIETVQGVKAFYAVSNTMFNNGPLHNTYILPTIETLRFRLLLLRVPMPPTTTDGILWYWPSGSASSPCVYYRDGG